MLRSTAQTALGEAALAFGRGPDAQDSSGACGRYNRTRAGRAAAARWGRKGDGRPRKKPDLYSELTKVLRENVTITIDGQQENATVQQALLLRLRDQALRGELWAEMPLQKVVGALPQSGAEYDPTEMELERLRTARLFDLVREESGLELAEAASASVEPINAER